MTNTDTTPEADQEQSGSTPVRNYITNNTLSSSFDYDYTRSLSLDSSIDEVISRYKNDKLKRENNKKVEKRHRKSPENNNSAKKSIKKHK